MLNIFIKWQNFRNIPELFLRYNLFTIISICFSKISEKLLSLFFLSSGRIALKKIKEKLI